MANSNEEMLKNIQRQMQEVDKLLAAQKRNMESQIDIISQLTNVFSKANLGNVTDQVKDLGESLSTSAKSAENLTENETKFTLFSKSINKTKEAEKKLNQEIDKTKKDLPAIAAIGTAAFFGFSEGISTSINLLKSVGSFGFAAVKSIGHVAASIITFPFKMLHALIGAADAGGSSELQQALENIRKEFGYLNKTAGGAIVQMSRSMRGELANTGLSTYRVFGNLAKRLEYFLEYAKAVGPAFDTMMHRIGFGGAEALGAYNKALGLSNEAQRGIAERAMALGREVNDVNREIANYALQLSNAFGVTMKSVSKDMGEMIRDVQHFGHLSVREIGQAAVYARKLGIEVKNLGQVMDKFLNFEDAAEGASRLSQAFGLNIDAMQLMSAQDPAQKLEMIRQAFFRAGRSVEQMTVQERRYLAQQTGLEDSAINLAFSLRGQAMSYDQIQRRGNAAQRTQLNQAEVLQRLSGAIERIVQSGSGDGSGFFDRFFRGFLQGIRWSREFRGIMINLRRDLHMTRIAGVQMGREFVRAYPPIQNFFNGIREMFNPSRFRQMLNGVKNALRDFFHGLAGDNRAAVFERLKTRLKETFLDFFNSRSQAGQMFLNGAKEMLRNFASIVNLILRDAINGVTNALTFITDLISGRQNLGSLLARARQGGGFIGEIFGTLTEGLQPLLMRLWDTIKTLFHEGWNKVKPFFISFGSRYLLGTLALSFGNAALHAFTSGVLIEALKQGTTNFMTRSLGNLPRIAASSPVQNAITQATQGVTAQITTAGQANVAAQRSGINAGSIAKMALIGMFIIGGIYLLFEKIKDMMMFIQTNHITPQTMMITAGAMGSISLVILAASGVAYIASQVNPANVGKALAGMVAISVLAVGMAYGGKKIIEEFHSAKNLTSRDVGIAIGAMTAVSLLMGAATGIMLGGALIGAIGSIGGGAGALMIIAGVATIVLVSQSMIPMAMQLMNEINKFRAQPGFLEKTRAFVSVVQAIGSFASIFTSVLGSTPGLLVSVFTGTNPSEEIRKNIKSIEQLVVVISDQAIKLLEKIIKSTRRISPDHFERARGFTEIMSNVGSLIQSLRPPESLTSSDTINTILTGESISGKLASLRTYTTSLMSSLTGFMTTIIDNTRNVATIHLDTEALNAARVFIQILNSVGQLARNLTPPPDIINAIAQAARTTNSGGWMSGLSSYIQNVLTGIVQSGLLGSIRTVVNDLSIGLANLNPRQVRNIQILSPILTSTLNAITAIMNTVGNITSTPALNASNASFANTQTILSEKSRMISLLFQSISQLIPSIINSVSNINLNPQQITNIRNIGTATASLFTALSSIMTTLVSAGGERTEQQIGNSIDIKMRLFTGMLGKITNPANRFNMALNQLSTYTMPTNIKIKLTEINRVMTNLVQTGGVTRDVISGINNLPETGRATIVETVGETIRSVVSQINATSDELSRITPNIPNINVALRTLANNLHMQGSNSITLERRNLTLNIPVTVSIEGRELQTVLVNTSNATQGNTPRLATTNTTGARR